MTALSRTAGQSGALFEVNGTIANNATWAEDIFFFEAGVGMVISDLDWKFTFRSDPNNDAADLTLAIGDGLSVENDSDGNATILRITVAAGSLSAYLGDYTADLASELDDATVVLWAHGIVTFTRNPVTF